MNRDELVLWRGDRTGVVTLALNRPDKLNALDPPLFEALSKHLGRLEQSSDVGCVILTGVGRSFSAGHDLSAIAEKTPPPRPHVEQQTIDRLEALPMPTIAMIRGHCLTGGLELALACDLLVASESATFADTHGQWGLIPIWGMSVRLPERVGRARAKELMFTSRRIDGAEAARIGLIDHVAPEPRLEPFVNELAAEIVANSWGTNRVAKQLLLARGELPRRAALEHERLVPFGRPDDAAERMARWTRAKGA